MIQFPFASFGLPALPAECRVTGPRNADGHIIWAWLHECRRPRTQNGPAIFGYLALSFPLFPPAHPGACILSLGPLPPKARTFFGRPPCPPTRFRGPEAGFAEAFSSRSSEFHRLAVIVSQTPRHVRANTRRDGRPAFILLAPSRCITQYCHDLDRPADSPCAAGHGWFCLVAWFSTVHRPVTDLVTVATTSVASKPAGRPARSWSTVPCRFALRLSPEPSP